MEVEDFIITGVGCFDYEVPLLRASRLTCVRPLLEVWQASLEPDEPKPEDYLASYDPLLSLDNVVYKRNESYLDRSKEYFVDIFCQSCRMSTERKQDLLNKFKSGLPQAVLLPLFTFIYLESDQHAYLHPSERHAVLFTFSTVSVLSQQQVEAFSHPKLKPGSAVPLMRAANMFRRAAQVMINLNAVCGFPISVEWVDGHNFWQGRFVQMFYEYLYTRNKSPLSLFNVIVEALQKLDCPLALERFTHLMHLLAELKLVDERVKKVNL